MEFQKGFTAYVTHFPCLNCTKQLLQVGCKRVVYIHQYRIDEYAEYLYREKEVELVNLPIEEVKRAIAEADFYLGKASQLFHDILAILLKTCPN